MRRRICLLPGDGIGPEVIAAAADVLSALPLDLEFTRAEIGYGAYQRHGTPLPEATLAAVRAADATLFGAVTTPPGIAGYFSPVVRMRQALDLYANVRPCCSLPHPGSRTGIDLVIVRENTEGLYAGIERVENEGERAVSERVITRRASERIVRLAFELARQRGEARLTVVHKANILRATCGLFRETALQVAQSFPEIHLDEMLVDTCALELARAPEQFGVLVTTNLFGDILSDEAAALVGGLGVAYAGNLGAEAAVFEPVHGSAPPLAGKNQANPMATLFAAAMMLEHLGEREAAERVRWAVEMCLEDGLTTVDLGGGLGTREVGEAVARGVEEVLRW